MIRRLANLALSFRDYADWLNRSAEVEAILWDVARGKREPLSPAECKSLAKKLGIPSWARRGKR